MDKIFHKPLPDHSLAQIRALFEHAQAVYEKVNFVKGCTCPKPLSCDKDGIDYQFIDLPTDSLSENLQQQLCTQEMIRNVGHLLAALHQDQSPSVLHSDFVPHNIFQEGGKLIIIDAHPPENLGYREDLLYGDRRRDIVAFVSCVFSNVGLKMVFSHLTYYSDMASAFLAGYRATRVLPSSFMRSVILHAQDSFRMKRIARIGGIRALGHAIIYGVITFLIVRVRTCSQKKS